MSSKTSPKSLSQKSKIRIGLVLIIIVVFASWMFLFQNCAICNLGRTSDNSEEGEYPRMDISVTFAYYKTFHPQLQKFALILDVRTTDEYDEGHLFDSVLIPYYEIESNLDDLIDYREMDILVYCRSGRRSQIASNVLISNNFTRVHNMLGGFNEWVSFGYPYGF